MGVSDKHSGREPFLQIHAVSRLEPPLLVIPVTTRVLGLPGLRFRVWGLGFKFRFRGQSSGFRVLCLVFRVSGFSNKDVCAEIQAPRGRRKQSTHHNRNHVLLKNSTCHYKKMDPTKFCRFLFGSRNTGRVRYPKKKRCTCIQHEVPGQSRANVSVICELQPRSHLRARTEWREQ